MSCRHSLLVELRRLSRHQCVERALADGSDKSAGGCKRVALRQFFEQHLIANDGKLKAEGLRCPMDQRLIFGAKAACPSPPFSVETERNNTYPRL
jgi:hypothetical protein